MKRVWFRALIVGIVLLGPLMAFEALFRMSPELLPASYREGFPMHGIEFSRPGVLSETPIEVLPLPWIASAWDGPPPADLAEKGLLSPEVEIDRHTYPRVVLPADERGLPNVEALDRANVVLVGDSFMVAAASREPPGLALRLEQELGKAVYNLSVAGIGPQREAWLLEHVGLGLEPELVLWCFFGGNDLVDARKLRDRVEAGVRTHADEEDYRAPPPVLLFDLARSWLTGGDLEPAVVPPVSFPATSGPHPFWFLPRHLFMLTMPLETLRGHRGWAPTQAALRESRRAVEERGGKFAVVYLPSKAQIYLPLVEQDAELIHRMLTFDGGGLVRSPEELLQEMLANRGAVEELLQSFCAAEGIPFFSATAPLNGLAERGELGYLTCDTHWAPRGQTAVAEALAPFCRDLLGP